MQRVGQAIDRGEFAQQRPHRLVALGAQRRTGTRPLGRKADLRVHLQPEVCGISDQKPVGQRAPTLLHAVGGGIPPAAAHAGAGSTPIWQSRLGREVCRGKPSRVGEPATRDAGTTSPATKPPWISAVSAALAGPKSCAIGGATRRSTARAWLSSAMSVARAASLSACEQSPPPCQQPGPLRRGPVAVRYRGAVRPRTAAHRPFPSPEAPAARVRRQTRRW